MKVLHRFSRGFFGAVLLILAGSQVQAQERPGGSDRASPYRAWKNGPPPDREYFPICVWLQSPGKAGQYREAGFNTYVGLWKGPTEDQLAALRKAGMKVICDQNAAGLRHLDDPTIIGWMHGDEPDNAQSLGPGKGYGPPVPSAKIIADYEEIRRRDPSRPVLLNLGQGVAWDAWHGRGVRTNHPEDYPAYVKGSDIVSFDIYPVVHSKPEVAGKLWYLARGVDRLVKWSEGKKVVWNCIECTRINNPVVKATPEQVRSEVWMSIIHGSMGLIYFVHEWKPRFNESALLSDREMLRAVTKINKEVTALAPVLHRPTIKGAVTVSSDSADVPIASMTKRHHGATYLFAVAMRDGESTATVAMKGMRGQRTVEVIGENRSVVARDGVFRDHFGPYGVHLYRLQAPRNANP